MQVVNLAMVLLLTVQLLFQQFLLGLVSRLCQLDSIALVLLFIAGWSVGALTHMDNLAMVLSITVQLLFQLLLLGME
jgi:hypothetical protein